MPIVDVRGRYFWNGAAAVVLLFVYVGILWVMPKDVFWSPDEGIRFITLETFHWDHGLRTALPYRGAALDPEFKFYPGRCAERDLYPSPAKDGSIRFRWSIWFPLVSRLFFSAFGLTGVYMLPLFCGWLTAVLAGVLASREHPRLGLLTILLCGLGTPICFFSLCFWEHTVATLCGVLAVALVTGTRSRVAPISVLVLLLLMIAVLLRFEMLAMALSVLGISAVARRTASAAAPNPDDAPTGARRWFAAVASGGVGLVLVAAALCALAPRHLDLLASIPGALVGSVRRVGLVPSALLQVFIRAADPRHPPASQVWEWLTLAAVGALLVGACVRSRRLELLLVIPSLALVLEFSLFNALSTRPYLSRHGVLLVAPYLVVGPYVLADAWRRRDDALLWVAAITVLYMGSGFLALFAVRITWDGAYQIGLDGGARYMLTLYPLGAVLSVVAVHRYRRSDRHPFAKSAFTVFVAAMMAAALYYQFRGVEMLYNSKQQLSRWERALPEQGPVVTDSWWLAACLANFFTSHEVYCVSGGPQVSEWVPAAAAHGIGAFTFVSFNTMVDGGNLPTRVGPFTRQADYSVEGMHLSHFQLDRTTQTGLPSQ